MDDKNDIDKIKDEIKKFIERYAQKKGYVLNPDKETLETLINGLAHNKIKYGRRYCPCRIVTGDATEDKKNICPCVYHEEEIKRDGHCHCMLFYDKKEVIK
ncbi:MAG: ferredoxin:thioredoxin reductase [Candidatus Methanoliparum thermophilum]|uniref:ferredoxin:thioredoxin reductase n=1 Tax=Methanoliparum thermophilum TaxID=2491083 RepID=A0A520KRW0_METT2|nr:ferredoxin-thioredoxin reductase catalytic domain-containing protein [Candidatus Methanoliparum sp. LAM-1]RZN64522.1 MAG: ferredoxin:thioredoxin reductase [Candidatus Methanoliparum thermophilum]BDC35881.1 ferredoxin:thioredoxin reductase [Candidatus Methanoliparum sp. LAM-1]